MITKRCRNFRDCSIKMPTKSLRILLILLSAISGWTTISRIVLGHTCLRDSIHSSGISVAHRSIVLGAAHSRRNRCKCSMKSHFTHEALQLRLALFTWQVVSSSKPMCIWKTVTDTMKSLECFNQSQAWTSPTQTTQFVPFKASSMLWELLSTTKFTAAARCMTLRRISGNKSMICVCQELECLFVLSRTTTSSHLEAVSTKSGLLIRLKFTTSQGMCGKRLRTCKSTNRIGCQPTWVWLTKLRTMRSFCLEERARSLSRYSTDVLSSTLKRWKSRNEEVLLTLVPLWTRPLSSTTISTLMETMCMSTATISLSTSGLQSPSQALFSPKPDHTQEAIRTLNLNNLMQPS